MEVVTEWHLSNLILMVKLLTSESRCLKGRSALDALELIIAWNYHREHMEPTQRLHYVVSDGGDQPNVVPSKAAVWYYFRNRSYPQIKEDV